MKTLVTFVTAAVLAAACGAASPVESAAGAIMDVRYVSSSLGDDRNDGRSPAQAWKTLAKVSAQTFGPGATIRLRRGDRWNEALIPRGSGDPAGRWITVEPYGPASAPKPTIERRGARGRDRDWAIKLVDLEAWRFRDLRIRNAPTGIVYLGSDESEAKRGLEIVRVDFWNITGLPQHTQRTEDDRRRYWWLRGSTAISITGRGYCEDGKPATDASCQGDAGFRLGSYGAGLSEVTISDVRIENATYGIWIWARGRDYVIRRPSIDRAGNGGIELTFLEDSRVIQPRIDRTGRDNVWSGTFGIDVNYSRNLEIEGGEVARTTGEIFYMGEGTGVNLAGPNVDVRVVGMRIHSNDGSAIAIQAGGPEEAASYAFVGNRVWNNALRNDVPASGHYEYPEFVTVVLAAGGPVTAAVRDNRIAVAPNRHLILIGALDLVDIWKDELSSDDPRLPGWSFCGNRSWSIGTGDGPLVGGNGACG